MTSCVWEPVGPGLQVVGAARSPTLSDADREAVDRIWEEEAARRPGEIFDGSLLVLVNRSGDRLEAAAVPYRVHLAQARSPELAASLDLHSLAVTGVLEGEGRVLLGRRSGQVAHYNGLLEFAPAGTLEARGAAPGDPIDFRHQLLVELQEELGIGADQVEACQPLGLVGDPGLRCWDIVCRLRLRDPRSVISLAGQVPSSEHDQLRVLDHAALAELLDESPGALVPSSASIAEALLGRSDVGSV